MDTRYSLITAKESTFGFSLTFCHLYSILNSLLVVFFFTSSNKTFSFWLSFLFFSIVFWTMYFYFIFYCCCLFLRLQYSTFVVDGGLILPLILFFLIIKNLPFFFWRRKQKEGTFLIFYIAILIFLALSISLTWNLFRCLACNEQKVTVLIQTDLQTCNQIICHLHHLYETFRYSGN